MGPCTSRFLHVPAKQNIGSMLYARRAAVPFVLIRSWRAYLVARRIEMVIQTSLDAQDGKAWVCSSICLESIQILRWIGPIRLMSGTYQMLSVSCKVPVWCCNSKKRPTVFANACSAHFQTQLMSCRVGCYCVKVTLHGPVSGLGGAELLHIHGCCWKVVGLQGCAQLRPYKSPRMIALACHCIWGSC